MSIVAPELDYAKQTISHGTYQYSQVIQQTNGTSVTISVQGGQESIFEIAPKCMNLSETVLAFTANIPALTSKTAYVYAEGMPYIGQIQLYTRTGLFLMDINDLNNYLATVTRRESKLADILGLDKVAKVGEDAVNLVGFNEGIQASNGTAATNYRPTDNTGGKTAFTEPLYLFQSASGGALTINYKWKLGRILNSICSRNNDLYFADILMLRIVWAASTKIYFTILQLLTL